MADKAAVIRIKPHHYIHVLGMLPFLVSLAAWTPFLSLLFSRLLTKTVISIDNNTNVTRVEVRI